MFFLFFFVSGFCSLVYEVVWVRLAVAKFGATTPATSIVLSVFMGGLALGSVAAGRLARRLDARGAEAPLRFYAGAELVIALSAVAVPFLMDRGRHLLLGIERGSAWGSGSYYMASALAIAAAILPFCICMGATFPLAMSAIRRAGPDAHPRSFSFLYLGNLLGATVGTLAAAFVLIEWRGFSGAMQLAAVLNVALAGSAFVLARAPLPVVAAPAAATKPKPRRAEAAAVAAAPPPRWTLAMLFTTGLISMAMEVVWIRQYTPVLGTMVYAFAGILAVYLAASALGSATYRRTVPLVNAPRAQALRIHAWAIAGAAGLAPLLATDPRLPAEGMAMAVARLALGLVPFCAAVGFLTPLLVDRWSAGDPDRAGTAYAVNVVGCILGPLLAAFVLLPAIGERAALCTLAAPLFVWWVLEARSGEAPTRRLAPVFATALVAAMVLVAATKDNASTFTSLELRRDYEATVIATGEKMEKQLLVNGYGMTTLNPITKMMVHIPLALRDTPPRDALVVCFGMGTSFRSALSWGIPATAVELVPSVPDLFGYYHADGPALLRSPQAHVVIDDGRRYLERTPAVYDLIIIDPPPPVQAAGSSLLYSRDFYETAKRRLRAGGMLQQWLPEGDATTVASVTRALTEVFPNVRIFQSVFGWGWHFTASMTPIPRTDARRMAARLPARAAADLMEWWPGIPAYAPFEKLLSVEVKPESLLAADATAPALQDDRPLNEYFLLRSTFGPKP